MSFFTVSKIEFLLFLGLLTGVVDLVIYFVVNGVVVGSKQFLTGGDLHSHLQSHSGGGQNWLSESKFTDDLGLNLIVSSKNSLTRLISNYNSLYIAPNQETCHANDYNKKRTGGFCHLNSLRALKNYLKLFVLKAIQLFSNQFYVRFTIFLEMTISKTLQPSSIKKSYNFIIWNLKQ